MTEVGGIENGETFDNLLKWLATKFSNYGFPSHPSPMSAVERAYENSVSCLWAMNMSQVFEIAEQLLEEFDLYHCFESGLQGEHAYLIKFTQRLKDAFEENCGDDFMDGVTATQVSTAPADEPLGMDGLYEADDSAGFG
jgi:hypothetical protein